MGGVDFEAVRAAVAEEKERRRAFFERQVQWTSRTLAKYQRADAEQRLVRLDRTKRFPRAGREAIAWASAVYDLGMLATHYRLSRAPAAKLVRAVAGSVAGFPSGGNRARVVSADTPERDRPRLRFARVRANDVQSLLELIPDVEELAAELLQVADEERARLDDVAGNGLQRAILAYLLRQDGHRASTSRILTATATKGFPERTVNAALTRLLNEGVLCYPPGITRGHYVLTAKGVALAEQQKRGR